MQLIEELEEVREEEKYITNLVRTVIRSPSWDSIIRIAILQITQLGRYSKISQFHFSIFGNQQVVRFDIAMDYTLIVEIHQPSEGLPHVGLREGFWKTPVFLDHMGERSILNEFLLSYSGRRY